MEMIIGMIIIMTYMYSLRIQDYFECFNCLPFSLRNHFFKTKKTLIRNAIREPNCLNPDQVPYFVWPDLGSECWQSKVLYGN